MNVILVGWVNIKNRDSSKNSDFDRSLVCLLNAGLIRKWHFIGFSLPEMNQKYCTR